MGRIAKLIFYVIVAVIVAYLFIHFEASHYDLLRH